MSQQPQQNTVNHNHVIQDSDDESHSNPRQNTHNSKSAKQCHSNLPETEVQNTKKDPANQTKLRQEEEEKQKTEESEDSDGESQFSKSESSSEQQSESEGSETESKKSALQPRKRKEQSKEEPPLKKQTKSLPRIQRTSERKEGVLSSKDDIIDELMVRWWYALPDWPPENHPYDEILRHKGYRIVPSEIFQFQNETDDNQLRKVMAVNNYVGVFRRSDGQLVDVRPKETMPCYANFHEKSKDELIELLKKALENQIRELKNTPSYQSKGQDVKLMKQVCRLYLAVKALKKV